MKLKKPDINACTDDLSVLTDALHKLDIESQHFIHMDALSLERRLELNDGPQHYL